jgi:hypothetical protein
VNLQVTCSSYVTLHAQYVKVASGQAQVMELGGNLPDTLIQFTMLGHGEDVDSGDEGNGITKREQQ